MVERVDSAQCGEFCDRLEARRQLLEARGVDLVELQFEDELVHGLAEREVMGQVVEDGVARRQHLWDGLPEQ